LHRSVLWRATGPVAGRLIWGESPPSCACYSFPLGHARTMLVNSVSKLFVALDRVERRIAGGSDLWFERPGISPVPPHEVQAATPVAEAVFAGPNRTSLARCAVKLGAHCGRFSGANRTMLKRLIALMVTGVTVLGANAAIAAEPTGQPHPWQFGLQAP